MGLEHLQGKRTGRPRGARTKSRLRQDIAGAYRNQGKPDAQPPSAGAGLWQKLAREQPAIFLECVVRVDTAPEQESENAVEADSSRPAVDWSSQPTRQSFGMKLPERVRLLFMSGQHLFYRLIGDGSQEVSNLPRDTHLVGCASDPARYGVLLVIYSMPVGLFMRHAAAALRRRPLRGHPWHDRNRLLIGAAALPGTWSA